MAQPQPGAAGSFFERVAARVASTDSLLVVGLDPHVGELGADATAAGALAFCARLVRATAPFAAAFKPNAAFFEVHGADGAAALAALVRDVIAPTGVPVLLDAKRGDIGTSSDAYAAAAYAAFGADAVTVNGYMGSDAVAPFSRDASKGVFVLCKTSNASADEVQGLRVAGAGAGAGAGEREEPVYIKVARLATGAWNGAGNVGLVVGATDSAALAAVRAAAPHAWILAPGVGFQGGDLGAALAAGLRSDGSGLLLPVSRGLSKAADPAAAAAELVAAIRAGRAARAAATTAAEAAAAATAAAAALPAAPAAPAARAPHAPGEPSAAARAFLSAALAAGALKFGSFTLKSGRVSPYFFNAGAFSSGAALGALGATYARAILDRPAELQFDVLFGPAYKGIPLVTAAAVELARAGRDVPVAYNRKEAKDHGEGGSMVGADVRGKRVLIIDDVISAGTAVGEAVAIIAAAGGTPAGVVIGLDRQERAGGEGGAGGLSAVQGVRAAYGVPVVAVARLADLLAFVAAAAPGAMPEGAAAAIAAYRAQYGVEED